MKSTGNPQLTFDNICPKFTALKLEIRQRSKCKSKENLKYVKAKSSAKCRAFIFFDAFKHQKM